jgi:predicted TIM-barrel enzyme
MTKSMFSRSTAKVFVEQQQFVFETLWDKAVPARQGFRELEKGVKTEFVETVRDAKEIQQLSFAIVKSAEEEIEMYRNAGIVITDIITIAPGTIMTTIGIVAQVDDN